MSLTDALRAAAPQAFRTLYDEYAGALYAYCCVMAGDEAGDALHDAFVTLARNPGAVPGDDAELPAWLHSLARAECVRRGALVRGVVTSASADPLRRALASLDPGRREVLALSNVLDPPEIAHVLGTAPATASALVREARERLERAAAAVGGQGTEGSAVLAALTGDALCRLVTLGYEPPAGHRERVLSSCAAAAGPGAAGRRAAGAGRAEDANAGTGERPRVRGAHARRSGPSFGRRLLPVAGVMACVLAATGAAFAGAGIRHAVSGRALVHPSVPPSRPAWTTPSGGPATVPDSAAPPRPAATAAPPATALRPRGTARASGPPPAARRPRPQPHRPEHPARPEPVPSTGPAPPPEPAPSAPAEPTPSAEPRNPPEPGPSAGPAEPPDPGPPSGSADAPDGAPAPEPGAPPETRWQWPRPSRRHPPARECPRDPARDLPSGRRGPADRAGVSRPGLSRPC